MPNPVTGIMARLMFADAMCGSPIPSSRDLEIRLFTGSFSPAPGSEIGEFTECTFGGYEAVAGTFAENVNIGLEGNDVLVQVLGAMKHFDCTSDPQTVSGWVVYSPDMDGVLWSQKYDVPHVLAVGSRHSVDIKVKFNQNP